MVQVLGFAAAVGLVIHPRGVEDQGRHDVNRHSDWTMLHKGKYLQEGAQGEEDMSAQTVNINSNTSRKTPEISVLTKASSSPSVVLKYLEILAAERDAL